MAFNGITKGEGTFNILQVKAKPVLTGNLDMYIPFHKRSFITHETKYMMINLVVMQVFCSFTLIVITAKINIVVIVKFGFRYVCKDISIFGTKHTCVL